MENFNTAIEVLTPKHGFEFGFLAIGAILIGSTYTDEIPLGVGAGAILILLGVMIFMGTRKQRKIFTYIKENYQTDPDKCLKMIHKEMESLQRAIERKERKALRPGRDQKDSEDDARRRRLRMLNYKDIETEILRYK